MRQRYSTYKLHQLSVLIIAVCFIILGGLAVSSVQAYDPHLRLPWTSGAGYVISGSQYGEGYHIENNFIQDFYAIDFGLTCTPSCQEVWAAQGGYATVGGSLNSGYGYTVTVDHGNGYSTMYAHLSEALIPNGKYITQGQLIAKSGCTGTKCDGPHLHFVARFKDANGVTHSYMPEPMSGYTGFGNPANYQSTVYTNNPELSDMVENGTQWIEPIFRESGADGAWQRDSLNTTYSVFCCGLDGNNYLEMTPGALGAGALFQQIPVRPIQWSNYYTYNTFINPPDTWTVRALIRSSCGSASGSLALYTLNGPSGTPNEYGASGFTVGGQWISVSATSSFTYTGHNRLRPTLYMDSPCSYDFDDVTVQRNYLIRSSFEEEQFAPWTTASVGCTVNYARYYYTHNSPAADDNWYLEANRGTCTTGNASILQDVTHYPSLGDEYYARMWIRSPDGVALTGRFHLGEVGGSSPPIDSETLFSIPAGDTSWQERSVSITIAGTDRTTLRVELHMDTNGAQYDFDGVQLWGGTGN